jgi:hypothetical protein
MRMQPKNLQIFNFFEHVAMKDKEGDVYCKRCRCPLGSIRANEPCIKNKILYYKVNILGKGKAEYLYKNKHLIVDVLT